MSGAEGPASGVDEFEVIARLLRPLAGGAPEALDLRDDAAVIPSRPGQDLVITADTLVEGVHFLADDPLDLVARKLLRVNLSDLAAKAAKPYGYFLCAAWPARCGWAERGAFAEGLAQDQARFGLTLMGGDTTATPGPLTLSITALGWTPADGMVRRGAGQPGDILLVSGTIGDGALGLAAALGQLGGLGEADQAALAARYRLPEPRLELRQALVDHAAAAADVSDGLLADAGHIGEASGCAVVIDLDRVPLSAAASAWADMQPVRAPALARLATGGDDYEIVCAVGPASVAALIAAAETSGVSMTPVGRLEAGEGLSVLYGGSPIKVERAGYRHG